MSTLGERYRITEGYSRLDAAAEQNAAQGAHLWIILTTYGLTGEEAAVATEGIDQLLDRDHLLAVTTIGCYLCEQPYREVAGKPCQGHPTHYAPDGTPMFDRLPPPEDGYTGWKS